MRIGAEFGSRQQWCVPKSKGQYQCKPIISLVG